METQSNKKFNRLFHAQRPGRFQHSFARNGYPPRDQACGRFLKPLLLVVALTSYNASYVFTPYLYAIESVTYAKSDKNVSYVNTTISSGDEKLADAIYLAEGGAKTAYPYGIRSVKCATPSECRRVCLNTIRNNRARWIKAGKPGTYLEFLASRYAPKNAQNDPHGLNNHWLKNVQALVQK